MKPEDFKAIRKKKGGQFKMAAILGVSQGQISIWENGYRPIPEDVAKKMEVFREAN